MQGAAPASHITSVPGWETGDEQEYLLDLARSLPADAVILEIGGEFGMSASIFSKGAPSARIYSVDNRFDGEVGQIHAANLAEAGLGANVKRISADSQLAKTVAGFKKIEKAGVDLLFVDGGHDYQSALNDLNLWTPLVKAGGYLVLHDTAGTTNRMPHLMHFDVSRALAMWYKDNGADWAVANNVNTITSFKRL